ncbi:MAG: hypothetical protein S0880_29075, partial [Actinomycetota bacterium]|nr:hypothetical protein [Actinomycetota bacterium]
MDLWTTIFAIFRRWYITVPVLIVAVVASFGIASGIKPSYELEGGIWLTTPTPRFFDDGTQVPVQNPLIVNGNVNSGLQIAFGHLGTAATREQFEETGYSPEYELTTNRDAAILQYVITAETEEQANETASALLDETTSVLQERQVAANVDPLDYIGVSQAFNSTPDVIDGGRIRTQATIIILGIVAAAAGALLVDGVAARRKGLAHNEPTMPAAYHPGYQMPMPGPYGYQQPMGNQPMPPQMGPMGPMGQPGAMVPQQPVDPGYTNGNGNGHSAPARPEPEPDDAYDDHSLDALLDDEPEPAPAPARRTNGAA